MHPHSQAYAVARWKPGHWVLNTPPATSLGAHSTTAPPPRSRAISIETQDARHNAVTQDLAIQLPLHPHPLPSLVPNHHAPPSSVPTSSPSSSFLLSSSSASSPSHPPLSPIQAIKDTKQSREVFLVHISCVCVCVCLVVVC